MFKLIQKYPKSFAAAVFLHIAFGLFFFISFDWTHKPAIEEPEVNVVQATTVDETRVKAELEKLKAMEAARKKVEEDRVRNLEDKARQAEDARKREQDRLKNLEKQRAEEQKRKDQLEAQRKQAEIEAKKAAADRATELAAKKKLEEERKQAEEAKRKADEQRRVAEEAKRKAEEEAKRVLREQAQAEEDRLRRQMMAEEEQRVAAERARAEEKTVVSFTTIIQNQVKRAWKKPIGVNTDGLSCDVKVRILPNGNVLAVDVVKTSGNKLFDNSVETAVRDAAPLPLPSDAALYKYFQEITFVFKP